MNAAAAGTPLVFDIQKYAIHDGDGIRTTVFFKGCPLHCDWCHNPESQRFAPELLTYAERCTGCGACAEVCGAGAVFFTGSVSGLNRESCAACGACADACPKGARELAGRAYPLPELLRELEKDRAFYEQSGGGVTLSGGEVLAQPAEYVAALAATLWQKGYSVDIDTCGYAPYERLKALLPYTDAFLYDLKAMDDAAHRRFTGVGNRLILENLRRLASDDARIYLRLPLIENVNADEAHIRAVIAFLRGGVKVERVCLLPYHDTGKGKYGRLDRVYDPMRRFAAPSAEKAEAFARMLRGAGFPDVRVGG